MATGRGARPKGSVEQIRQRGGDALALAVEFRSVIEPRLASGAIDGLAADLPSIGGVVPSALSARVEKKAATGRERATAQEAADHIASIREMVRDAFGGAKGVLKAWGVGSRLDAKITKSVLAAGNLIVGRAATNPDEARAAGVLDEDLATLNAQLAALQGADETQSTKGRASKEATSTRDATLVRIENATQTIGVRGRQAFLAQPKVRARFEKLLAPYAAKKKASKPAKALPGATS